MLLEGTDRNYFEKLYQTEVDPFKNHENDYERFKRTKALGLLEKSHYDAVFEPGCGNGGFTREIAPHAGYLLASDWSKDALDHARAYCLGFDQVEFAELDFPMMMPPHAGEFDLIIVSELLYYFSDVKRRLFFDALPQVLKPGAEALLLHWLGKSVDYPSHGHEVHSEFHELPFIKIRKLYEHPQFMVSVGVLA